MNVFLKDLFLSFEIVFNQSTFISAIVEDLVKCSPFHVSDFMISWSFDFLNKLWTSFFDAPAQAIFQIIDSHRGLSRCVLKDNSKIFVTIRELDLGGNNTWNMNFSQLVSILAIKNFDTDSCGSG